MDDVPEAHLMYWLILNKPRNATKIGIAGIGAAAVTMTRAFGANLTKNPIFVNQEGDSIAPPNLEILRFDKYSIWQQSSVKV